MGRLPLNPVALKGETILFFHCSSSQNTYLKLMQPLQRTVWRLLKKLKLELSYDPAIPLLGIYLEKKKTLTQRDTCTPIFIAALFIVLKTWKPLKCPSADEWIKKMWYIYTLEYYTAIKKHEVMPFAATWMDLEIIILSEVSQTEKKKYDITYIWNLKKMIQMNLFLRKQK